MIYKALLVEELNEKYQRRITELDTNNLPDNEVLINVKYSSLNYKDALSCIGNKGVSKNYPHTPGIDASGIVVESNNPKFKKGDEVIVTSYDLGMNTAGGFGQYIKVPSEWVIPLPANMTLKESMILGTAGLTAGMSIKRITDKISKDSLPVAISGATGGVGSMCVGILGKLGYKVAAITGKESESDYLKQLGATEIIMRSELEEKSDRPLLKSRFSAAIDTVGGPILENLFKSIGMNGVIAICGLVASPEINITVFPFILRGLSVYGIDSQDYPMSDRMEVWNNLASEWKPDSLMEMYDEVGLDGLSEKVDLILKGNLKRRVLVNLDK